MVLAHRQELAVGPEPQLDHDDYDVAQVILRAHLDFGLLRGAYGVRLARRPSHVDRELDAIAGIDGYLPFLDRHIQHAPQDTELLVHRRRFELAPMLQAELRVHPGGLRRASWFATLVIVLYRWVAITIFFEVNRALHFDRDAARGMRLDIAGGTAMRIEPAEEKKASLVALAGSRIVFGLRCQ